MLFDREPELGSQAHRTQRTHCILEQRTFGDGSKPATSQVVQAAQRVDQRQRLPRDFERHSIDREVAPGQVIPQCGALKTGHVYRVLGLPCSRAEHYAPHITHRIERIEGPSQLIGQRSRNTRPAGRHEQIQVASWWRNRGRSQVWKETQEAISNRASDEEAWLGDLGQQA